MYLLQLEKYSRRGRQRANFGILIVIGRSIVYFDIAVIMLGGAIVFEKGSSPIWS
jgi:hypothetical protein